MMFHGSSPGLPKATGSWPLFSSLARRFELRLLNDSVGDDDLRKYFADWADSLDSAIAAGQATPRRTRGKRRPRSTDEGGNS